MTQFIHTRLGEDRRVAIPAKVCARLGITVGDPLVLEEDNDSLRLIPCSRLLHDVQAVFEPFLAEGKASWMS